MGLVINQLLISFSCEKIMTWPKKSPELACTRCVPLWIQTIWWSYRAGKVMIWIFVCSSKSAKSITWFDYQHSIIKSQLTLPLGDFLDTTLSNLTQSLAKVIFWEIYTHIKLKKSLVIWYKTLLYGEAWHQHEKLKVFLQGKKSTLHWNWHGLLCRWCVPQKRCPQRVSG